MISKATETMRIVDGYFDIAGRCGGLDKPLILGDFGPLLVDMTHIHEISPKERYNYAQVIRQRKAKQQ